MEEKLRSMFTDPAFRAFSEKGIPNRLYTYRHEGSKVGIIVARASSSDHSLSVAGLDYIVKAKQDGRITKGFVVLARGENGTSEFVAAERGEKVKANLAGVPPLHGQWGAYCWLSPEFALPGEGDRW
jgi:hypothetical protein